MGHEISRKDVDAAINQICEESLPLEVDITHFIHSFCDHVHHLVEKANLELRLSEDREKAFPFRQSSSKEEESTDELTLSAR